MIGDNRQHVINERVKSLENLHAIPDDHRASHFVDNVLAESIKRARRISVLNPTDAKARELKIDKEKLMKRLVGHVELLDRRSAALENLIETTDISSSRTKALITRHRSLRDKHSNVGKNRS